MFGHGRKLGNTDKEQSPVILLSGDADGEGNGDGDDGDNGGEPTMVTGQKLVPWFSLASTQGGIKGDQTGLVSSETKTTHKGGSVLCWGRN